MLKEYMLSFVLYASSELPSMNFLYFGAEMPVADYLIDLSKYPFWLIHSWADNTGSYTKFPIRILGSHIRKQDLY